MFHSFGAPARPRRFPSRPVAAALLASVALAPARADEFREIDTKYIFGFTIGTGIGLEGEKEFSIETIARFGKSAGSYTASETKLEFEHTPNQYVQIEFGALVSSHNISGVPDLDDRSQMALSGAFAEFRYLAVERGPSSPFAVTLSVEPTVRRIDETSGEEVRNYELETRLAVDTELIANRLYLGFNALYEPEWTHTAAGDIVREATVGFSAALTFRPIPPLTVGVEAGYFRHYDSFDLGAFTGDALFVGPTLYLQTSRKTFITAAWATQVLGSSTEEPGPLNLGEFSRHRGKLKFAVEF